MTDDSVTAAIPTEWDDLHCYVRTTAPYRLAENIAALRRERDEAHASIESKITTLYRRDDYISELVKENAQMAAALRRIDSINDNPACYNPTINALIEAALAQPPAPAANPPSKIIGALEQAARGEASRVTVVEVAAPAPGLRDAVIEECAKALEATILDERSMNCCCDLVANTQRREDVARIRALADPAKDPA